MSLESGVVPELTSWLGSGYGDLKGDLHEIDPVVFRDIGDTLPAAYSLL